MPAFVSNLLPTQQRMCHATPLEINLAKVMNALSPTNLRPKQFTHFSTPKSVTIASLVLLLHLMVVFGLLRYDPQWHQVHRFAASVVSVNIELPSLVFSQPSLSRSLSRPTASKKLIDTLEKTPSHPVSILMPLRTTEANLTSALTPLSAIDASIEVPDSSVISAKSSGSNSLFDALSVDANQQTQLAATLPIFDTAYLNNPSVSYPALSKKLGEQGRVLLRVLVSEAGRAERVTLYISSGFTRLDMAALEAVKRWQFSPARLGDKAVSGIAIVPINFQLS